MRKLCLIVSEARSKIRKLALDMAHLDNDPADVEVHKINLLVEKMNRGYFTKTSLRPQLCDELKDETPIMQRRRRRRSQLHPSDIIEIVHRVLVGNEYQADVAKEFRIHKSVVSMHVSKVRKKPSTLSEIIMLREKKMKEEALVDQIVQDIHQ